MSTARAYVMHPDDAPGFWQLGNLWRVMATGVQTGNSFCLLDQLVLPDGGGPCTHTHAQDEGLYVISGHCTFNAGGLTIPAPAGSFVSVPRRTEHSFTVDAPGTQLLNFYLPAGFEIILMGLAHPAERNELPPPGVTLPPRRLVEQLSRDYGQTAVLGLPFADPPGPDNMATKPTPDAAAQPFLADAQTAPAYWNVGGLWTVLADGAATDGSFSLIEQLMPPGPQAPPHIHEGMDEVFYMLDGEAELLLENR
ncbi:MAG: cupin domain-containing protein, partial [Gemmatimonadaceae bacterium]|nr:cupin domain-containing protein [Acetobacteraceae bacterium]